MTTPDPQPALQTTLAPEPVQPEPEVIVPAPEPAPEPAPSTDIAIVDPEPEPDEAVADAPKSIEEEWCEAEKAWQDRFDPDWAHQRLEFRGDYLAVRYPTRAQVAPLQITGGKYAQKRNQGTANEGLSEELYGLLVAQLLAPDSYAQVMWRMMSFDEPDFTEETIGDILKELIEIASKNW